MRVLILYATRRNSTAEVANYVANILKEAKLDVSISDVETFEGDISAYDAYVIGTGIYTGMWAHALIEKLRQARKALLNKPVWGFALCIRVLEDGGEAFARENYLPEILMDDIDLRDFQFFAGKFLLQDIDLEDRWTLAIRYDGQTPPENYNNDYRDWDTIGAWARNVAASIKARAE